MKSETKLKIILFVQKLIGFTPEVKVSTPFLESNRQIRIIKWAYEVDERKLMSRITPNTTIVESLKYKACDQLIKEAFNQGLIGFKIEDRRIPELPLLFEARMDILAPSKPIVIDETLYKYTQSQ